MVSQVASVSLALFVHGTNKAKQGCLLACLFHKQTGKKQGLIGRRENWADLIRTQFDSGSVWFGLVTIDQSPTPDNPPDFVLN